jgi:hypothetical protein
MIRLFAELFGHYRVAHRAGVWRAREVNQQKLHASS